MATGNYDHPSFLTRQQISLGKSVAGANGTGCIKGFPASNIRIRNIAAAVVTAGTSAGAGHEALIYCLGTCTTTTTGVGTQGTGTTALGTCTIGTSSVGQVLTTGDVNAIINQGSIIFAKNGTDATGVYDLVAEAYLDQSASWTGTNN